MGDILDAGGRKITVRKDLQVPMRDGVTLVADAVGRRGRAGVVTGRGRAAIVLVGRLVVACALGAGVALATASLVVGGAS